MLLWMKSGQSCGSMIGQRIWGKCHKCRANQQGLFAAASSETMSSFSPCIGRHLSQEGFLPCFREERGGGARDRSVWPFCFSCFLKSLQLKIFQMLRGYILGYHVLNPISSFFINCIWSKLCFTLLTSILQLSKQMPFEGWQVFGRWWSLWCFQVWSASSFLLLIWTLL